MADYNTTIVQKARNFQYFFFFFSLYENYLLLLNIFLINLLISFKQESKSYFFFSWVLNPWYNIANFHIATNQLIVSFNKVYLNLEPLN